jgi:hypothetical protein
MTLLVRIHLHTQSRIREIGQATNYQRILKKNVKTHSKNQLKVETKSFKKPETALFALVNLEI